MEESNTPWVLWVIFGVLIAVLVVLYDISGTLKGIYSDTHYTSASTDYLLDIKNALER